MVEPHPNYPGRPGVDHTRCTQMGGVCVGWHCSKCGEPSSSQGHFGHCDPEKVALHQEWLAERASLASDLPELLGEQSNRLAPTGEEITTGLAEGFDDLLGARLTEEFDKLHDTYVADGEG